MPSFLECDNCLQTGTFVDANIPYTKTKFILTHSQAIWMDDFFL